jgi:hypothetical protein
MAKERSPQKATESPRRPSADSGSPEANRDAELLEGANATAFVKELLQTMKTLVAQNESQQESIKTQAAEIKLLKGAMRTVVEGVTDIYSQIADIPKPAAPKKVEELAEAMFKKRIQTDSRTWLWQLERRQTEHEDSKYHLPRPSIVGRALHELGAFGKNHWQAAGAIFQEIEVKGPHHVKQVIKKYLKAYVRPDGSKDKTISGKLGDQLAPRLEKLIRKYWVETGKKGCWLTPRGKEIFDGWPDYGVQDDDFECLGEFMAASPPLAAKSKAMPPAKTAAASPKP